MDATRRSQTAVIPDVTAACAAIPVQGYLVNSVFAESTPKIKAPAPMRGEPSGHDR